MRASGPARLILVAAGIATALTADRAQIAITAPITAAGFLLAGEWRLGLRLVMTLVPLLLFSALLWLFVSGVDAARPGQSLAVLFDAGAPFLTLVRTLAGSCAIVLALGTAPDGEGVVMLRRMGLPVGAATIIASGGAIAGGVGEGFSRSLASLRAHGVLGPSRWSRLRHLGTIVALTWTASLSEIFARAEGKWAGNGFLAELNPVLPKLSLATIWGTSVLLGTSLALIATLVEAWRWL